MLLHKTKVGKTARDNQQRGLFKSPPTNITLSLIQVLEGPTGVAHTHVSLQQCDDQPFENIY
mgnify:CR=1 FL=1